MCGIVGIIGAPEAAREAFLGLTTLQHRGQDAAGILTFDENGFHRVKNLGLVEAVFNRENMETLPGSLVIGHVRYSTTGRGDLIDVQPFLLSYPFGLGMVHNGNIVNCEELAKDLRSQAHRHLLTHSDTEVVLNLLAENLASVTSSSSSTSGAGSDARSGSGVGAGSAGSGVGGEQLGFDQLCEALTKVFDRLNGSYSVVTIVADHGLLAFRDPNGIRPLVFGKRKEKRANDSNAPQFKTSYMVASESVALSFLGFEVIRDLKPGEVLYIDLQGKVYSRMLTSRKARPCMFEWVYFASPESILDGVPVYGSRIQLGKNLALQIKKVIAERKLQPDLIVPVPETSRIAAISLAEELGIPYRELLIKNRYIKRTFILDSQEKRQKAVNLKLSPVRSEIQGKRILLIDDSIVRGTTSKKIIELVRQAGAAAVYFVSTCPPIQHPCYYGIDFPSSEELIASGRTLSEIEKELGADAVIYQSLEGLKQSICDHPCTACLDGKYPTDITAGAKFTAARTLDRKKRGER